MNLFANTVLYYFFSITTPIFCLYLDQRLGVEADVNGKQEERYDDSLISSHNFRKKQGDILKVWRKSGNDRHQYLSNVKSLKNQISNLRRIADAQKPAAKGQSTKIDDVIDVKFRKDKPKRRANYDMNTDFVYHDKMEDEGAGDVADFESNLKAYEEMGKMEKLENAVNYLHGDDVKPSRRSGNNKHVDSEKEILFHHAVPIDLKIYGYLQLPLEE